VLLPVNSHFVITYKSVVLNKEIKIDN